MDSTCSHAECCRLVFLSSKTHAVFLSEVQRESLSEAAREAEASYRTIGGDKASGFFAALQDHAKATTQPTSVQPRNTLTMMMGTIC